jgi:PAS domain-containing protein
VRTLAEYPDFVDVLLQAWVVTPAPVAVVDRDMIYVTYTQRWVEAFGLEDQGSLIGRGHYDVFPTLIKERPDWVADHQRCFAGERLDSPVEGDTWGGLRFDWSLRPVRVRGGDPIAMVMWVSERVD